MIVSGDVMNSSKVYMEGVLQAAIPVLVYNGAWDGAHMNMVRSKTLLCAPKNALSAPM